MKFISISLIDFLMNDITLSVKCIVHLKDITFYVHQNYLILVDFILSRLPSVSSENVLITYVWANSLRNIVVNKKAKNQKKLDNHFDLKRNSDQIINLISNITKICKKEANSFNSAINNTNKRENSSQKSICMINAIQNIIRQLAKCSVRQSMEILEKALESSVKLYS